MRFFAGLMLYLFLSAGTGPSFQVFGQSSLIQPSSEIQEAYHNGNIDAEKAILEHFRLLFEPGKVDKKFMEGSGPLVNKCLTPAFALYNNHKHELSAAAAKEIQSYRQELKRKFKVAQENYTSPSGKFEIVYETSGTNSVDLTDDNNNSVPDYIEEVGIAADSSYRLQVLLLGYPDPIPSGEVYTIYVTDIGNGIYGFTTTTGDSPGTEIYIETDYSNFPPNTDPDGQQLGAMRVTVAHEFKHAIQFVQNNWANDSNRWAEMDATLMEEVVYDQGNDYYNYISGFSTDLFKSPSASLIPGSYEDITWALYFHERFGQFFWPDVWERIEQDPVRNTFLQSVSEILDAEYDSDFKSALLESYMWHYASGDNAPSNYGFEERREYPDPFVVKTFTSVPNVVSDSSYSFNRISANYLEVNLQEKRGGMISTQITYENPDILLGLVAHYPDSTAEVLMAFGDDSDETTLETPWLWSEVLRLGIVVSQSDPFDFSSFKVTPISTLPNDVGLSQNYPNPFNPSTTIPFSIPRDQRVTLEVFDYLGRKVRTIYDNRQLDANFYFAEFSARDMASGIYIYRLITEEGVRARKMTYIK